MSESILTPGQPPTPSGGGGMGTKILAGAVVALLAGTGYLYYELNQVRSDLTATKASLLDEIEKVRETSTVTTQSSRRNMDTLRDQLETARRQANMAVGQAKADAMKNLDAASKKLEAAQAEQKKVLGGQISEVKVSADTANTKVGEVGTEVTAVKGDVASTKAELEKTIADLKHASGELDGQGVAIATNAKELAALRQLGERNYFEFKIQKTKAPQKVGDVLLTLKKADPKHNRYTIEVIADDKTTEKKDRTVNEPLQFYVSKARQPYEIVVNDVRKDQIAGYLSTPKVQQQRN